MIGFMGLTPSRGESFRGKRNDCIIEGERNLQVKLGFVRKLAAHNVPVEQIAQILGLEEAIVRSQIADTP